jgi:hypothetical protein
MARCTKDSSRNSTRSASSPSTRTITSQSRRDRHLIREYFEYPKYLPQPRTASCPHYSVSLAIAELACRPSARTATPSACASSCADPRSLQQLRRPRVSPACAGCGGRCSTVGTADWTAGGIADGIGRGTGLAGRPSVPLHCRPSLPAAQGRRCRAPMGDCAQATANAADNPPRPARERPAQAAETPVQPDEHTHALTHIFIDR